MYTYRIYLDGGNLVIGTYESNVLKGEAKHLPRGLVAVAGNTNTTITLNRVVNNLPTLANIEHPDLRDSNGNVWGANRTAVIAAINSFIQSTGGGNVISVNGQTGTVSLGLQNLVNVTTITPTQGDVLSYNSSGNWVLNSGLQYLLSKVKSSTATQTSLEVDNNYKINIDATQGKTTIVHAGSSVATFGAQKALLPGVTVGTTGNTYDLPAARGTATGQVPVFNASNNTTSFQAVKVADLSGSTDDLAQGATNLFFTSAEQSKLAGIQSGAEVNVNADWNSSSGDSQILNKPTLSTVATSGSYNDLSNLPSIPAAYTDSDVDNHLNTATATTGQILSWTGSDYDWVLDAAGAPAGTVGQLQYNNSGIFGASSNLFWDISNNRLGIGTTTPAHKLDVNGTAKFNNTFIVEQPVNGTNAFQLKSAGGIYTHTIGALTTGYDLSIFSARNLFINLGAASDTLHINRGGSPTWMIGDNIQPAQSGRNIYASHNAAFGFYTYGGTTQMPVFYQHNRVDNNNYGYKLVTKNAGTEVITISATYLGNVGINTSTPTYKLDVNGTTRIQSDLTVTTTNATGDFATIDASNILRKRTAAQVLTDIGAQAALTNPITGTGANGQVAFWNASNTQTGDNGLFWDNTNKRLGIGIATPTTKLDVNGAIYSNTSINVGLTPVSGRYLNVRTNNLNSGSAMYAQAVHGDGRWALYGTANTDTHRLIYVWHTGKYVGWGEGGNAAGTGSPIATRGTTGEVYFALNKRLIWYDNGLGPLNTPVPLVISTNTTTNIAEFYSTTINNTNLVQAAGFQYSANYHRFRTGDTTDGSTLPNTQEGLYISQEGRVGIGTITPSEKLDVVGKINLNDGSNNVLISTGNSTITATNTTAVGYEALRRLTTGAENTAIGYQAADLVTTGSYNVSVGSESAKALTTGSYNISVGWSANGSIATTSNNVAVGHDANRSTGANNTAIGHQALGNTSGTASNTTAIGYQAGLALTTGASNIFLGDRAGSAITTGNSNVIIGQLAGTNVTIRSSNVIIGNDANATTGTDNGVAIGTRAYIGGGLGTSVGWYSGEGSTGIGNTLCGYNTMRLSSGDYNAVFGGRSMYMTNGSNNAILGAGAMDGGGSNNNNNVAIGANAFFNGSGNVVIGYNAASTSGTLTNKLYIENSDSASPLIYGEFDTDLVRINGSFEVTSTTTSAGLYASNQTELRLYELTANGTNYIALKAAGTLAGNTTYTLPTADGSAGQTLTTDASGNMSWAYPKSPVKSEAGTAYTLVLADAGKYIRMTATTAITITIPQDIFAVGDEFFFEQNNTGQVTVAAGTGVTLRNTAAFLAKTAERYAIIGLKCVASNEFILTGERELV